MVDLDAMGTADHEDSLEADFVDDEEPAEEALSLDDLADLVPPPPATPAPRPTGAPAPPPFPPRRNG